MFRQLFKNALSGLLIGGAILSGCRSNTTDTGNSTTVEIRQTSVTPNFVTTIAPGVQAVTLISSDDTLRDSPNFVFGGMADGAGLLKNSDGTFTLITNHEDNFAVSRVRLDQTFRPISGDYLMNSNDGLWRLCSATMVTPEVHGVASPRFITCGESGFDSQSHIVDPNGAPSATDRILTNFGYWSAENAVTLPRNTYPNQTVTIIGDDDFQGAGEVALYVGQGTGNFDNGRLFVMARADNNRRERAMVTGQTYNIEFREITNPSTRTAPEFNSEAARLSAISFGRVEDLDYRKGSDAAATEIYFCVTGQNFGSGANADSSRTMYGRVYRLRMDPANPLRGTLEVVFDGDDVNGPARQFMNVDNICVTNDFVYIQEDPNRYPLTAFDGQRQNHDARIYQWGIGSPTSSITTFLEVGPPRTGGAMQDKYLARTETNGATAPVFTGSDGRVGIGDWEYGAMIDVSNETGRPGTFLVCVQSHTWKQGGQRQGRDFRNPDRGTLAAANNTQANGRPGPTNLGEGSYILTLTNVPR